MIELYLLAAGALSIAVFIAYRFFKADGDFLLLNKGPPPLGAFEDKVIWITGASQGIGESLAIGLASLGARLILSSRNVEKLQSVKNKCEGKHVPDGIELVPLDLSLGSGAVKAAVQKAESLFNGSGVDIIVHNAGYPRPKMTCEESSEEFMRAMFEVNVFAPIELTRAALPFMINRGHGHIAVVSSAAGLVPSPTQGVYAATKHAINGYFHTLRYELIEKGIGVTVVCPGPIGTPTPRRLPQGSGSHGADVHSAAPDDKEEEKNRMTSQRCADLIIAAIGHGFYEAWISRQPVLLFMYIMQYCPWLGHSLLRKIGPKRVRALKEGEKDLYNFNLLLGRSSVDKSKSS